MLACLLNLNLLAMASVGYVQMLKKYIYFSRAGMRNEWSSRISAMLDITIEDDEGVSPYVSQVHT